MSNNKEIYLRVRIDEVDDKTVAKVMKKERCRTKSDAVRFLIQAYEEQTKARRAGVQRRPIENPA